MNPILELLVASARFTLKHAWPLLAAAAGLTALQFGLDLATKPLEPLLEKADLLAFAIAIGFGLLQALILTFYVAAVYTMIYNRLGAAASGYRTFRDRLRSSFPDLFIYTLIVTLFGSLFLPFLVFLPFVEILILFENQRLGRAVRRNLRLLLDLPWPALTVSALSVLLGGLIPLLLLAGEASLTARSLYGYAVPIISMPLNVALIALYLNLNFGRSCNGFPDLPQDDSFD